MQWRTESSSSAGEPEARWSPTDFSGSTVRRRASRSVDRDDAHVYQPGLLFVPFGLAEPARSFGRATPSFATASTSASTRFRASTSPRTPSISRTAQRSTTTCWSSPPAHRYSQRKPTGLTGPAWGTSIHTFYSLEGASALRRALDEFDGGRLVVNMIDMPIKCPVAPLEFCFLADWQLRERGLRDRVELTFVTPLDGAFTKPVASAHLECSPAGEGHRRGGRVRHWSRRCQRQAASQLG